MLQVLAHLIKLIKNSFVALKAQVDKLNIDKLVNASTGLNDLKIKVENCSCNPSHKNRKDSLETRPNRAYFLYNLSSENY